MTSLQIASISWVSFLFPCLSVLHLLIFKSGSPTAVSDLTPAAGWQILDCDSNSTAQDIRAVCADPSASCEHLFQGGAVGTIVRLPENVLLPFPDGASDEMTMSSVQQCPSHG